MTTETRGAVETLVHRLLVDKGGASATTRRPIGTTTMKADQPTDYVAGISAARGIAAAAEGLMREYATRARGEGLSWEQIAPALPIDLEDTDAPAIDAFRWVAPRPSMPFDRVATSWLCTSCGQRVTDRGPYSGNPADDEEGHAEGCTRHDKEVRELLARAGWDDDQS